MNTSDMDSNDIQNNSGHNSGSSSIGISQPPTTTTSTIIGRIDYSSINILVTGGSRRSAHLSSKSPRKTSLTRNKTVLHRIISGVVDGSHSPKLNVHKRNSTSTDTQNTVSSITQ